MDLLDILRQEWAMRALLASIMIGTICGILGTFIVLRNMSLIGDALSHAVLPGVVVAFIFFGQNSLALFLGAALAGLLTSAGITWIQNNAHTKSDAAIGIVFITMFSLGVIGISAQNSKEGVHLDLKDFLLGSIIGVSPADLELTFFILLLVLGSVILLYRSMLLSTFQENMARVMGVSVSFIHYYLMLLLSFAVVASLRTVGVILVLAMLVTPASTALLLSHRLRWVLVWSAAIGISSAVGGMIMAIYMDLPPGAAMAVLAAIFYGLAVIFAPRRGKLFQWLRQRQVRQKILEEDILKATLKLGGQADIQAVSDRLEISVSRLTKVAQRLLRQDRIAGSSERWSLTATGESKAYDLLRAHRLWERYLVDKMGLKEDQIHDEAEELEHSLSEEILDEVDAALGYPHEDPHGSPIPPSALRKNGIRDAIDSLAAGQKLVIAPNQYSNKVIEFLWNHGLQAGDTVAILEKKDDSLLLRTTRDQTIEVSRPLLRQLRYESTSSYS